MKIRFYRRFPIIPGLLWMNIYNFGISFSIGRRGFRITRNRHGYLFTIGLTGTGFFASKLYGHRQEYKVLDSSNIKKGRVNSVLNYTSDNKKEK